MGSSAATLLLAAYALPRGFGALFFDDLHLDLVDVQRTRDAAVRFMASSLQATDRAGTFSASGQLTLDFTSDRNALPAALSRLQPRGRELQEPNAGRDIGDYQAYLIPEVARLPALRAAGTASLQTHEPRALTYPPDVGSVVTWPLPEVLKTYPELKGLEPAEGQEDLPGILEKVGEKVRAFFDSFANTASVESISMDRVGQEPGTSESGSEKFQYLALAHSLKGCTGLDEYRTNPKGERLEPHGLTGSYFITQGFVSTPLHFHPSCQADSAFRYLGQQVIEKRQTYVVAFAQRPGVARTAAQIRIEDISILVFVQGIAWIDSSTYQIVRMRTDLLPSQEEMGRQE